MSAILAAIFVITIATLLGVCSADIAGKLSYKLFNAQRGGEKYIIQSLGGVVGFAVGSGAVTTGNLIAALYGPPLAVLWITVVFLVLIGAGKFFFAIFR